MINVNEIKALMVRKNVTQKEVAKLLGVTEKTLYLRMKNNKLHSDDMDNLIRVLDIQDPNYVFFNR